MAWAAPGLSAASLIAHQLAYGGADAAAWLFSLTFVVYAAVGGLIVDRHPRNPVGWLFCVIGVVFPAGDLLSTYASDTSQPPGATAIAVATLPGATDTILVGLALMLFPTGRYLSEGWRRAGIALICANAAWALVLLLEPGPMSSNPRIDNPLGVDALAGMLHDLADAGNVVLVATLVIAIASVVARFRAVRGLERQQLKWLALSAVVALVVFGCLLALGTVVDLDHGTGQIAAGAILAMVFATPPITAAVAILRYRLYDVDVVIRRTLVYGALTAALGATYLGLVVVIGLAVGRSGFAVAASTLAVAALFRPARARIQGAVDRRFYRSRYDAARTLEAFSGRLRDELDLEMLAADLRTVVNETVQPAHVSLWLRRTP